MRVCVFGWHSVSTFIYFHFTDINELNLPRTCNTEFPDPDDLLTFKLIICPDEGFYKDGRFVFNFKVCVILLIGCLFLHSLTFLFVSYQVGPNYPHEPPKVKCETQVYHPNIDLEGNVCLNILREDWKPVLTVNSIVYGLQYLFLVSFFLFYSQTETIEHLCSLKGLLKMTLPIILQCSFFNVCCCGTWSLFLGSS